LDAEINAVCVPIAHLNFSWRAPLPSWKFRGGAVGAEATSISDFEGTAQGTTYHVSYLGKSSAETLKKKTDAYLAAFDKIYSNYRPDSEISRVNAYQGTDH
jgi:thiamine biosynthesis lipoprotein ApbE